MLNGVPLEQIASTIAAVGAITWTGVTVSAFFNVSYTITNKLAPWFSFEPMHPEEPKMAFDRFIDAILHPLGSKVGARIHSPLTTKVTLQLSLGAVVLTLAIVSEIVGLFAVAGLAVASPHLVGASFDFTAAYQSIVATVAFLTVVTMNYGTKRIKESTRYV